MEAYARPLRRAELVRVGRLEVGAEFDPGLPCRLVRRAEEPEFPYVRALTLREGYQVFVATDELATVDRIRRCA